MPDLPTLGLFALACLALTATPGPDMLLIATRSVSQGRSAGFATFLGIAAGTYCHALAAAFGLSQLFLAAPIAYDIVRYAGAAYLAFLAWKAFRSPGASPAPVVGLLRYSRLRIFRQGLLTNLLNPKMALFVLALFPQFVRLEIGSVSGQILILATVLKLVGLAVNGFVILTASRIGRILSKRSGFRRAPQIVLGSVFAGLAARLVFAGQR